MNKPYVPDRWVVIEIFSPKHGFIKKVMGGWLGGYLNGDSWKINSGIEEVKETADYYDFHGFSGSIYRCYKQDEGTSSLMNSVLSSYAEQMQELNDGSYLKVIESYKGEHK